jgi:predicted enzyme related to lactoylglutathione lyase
MAKVTGVGGIFLRVHDAKAMMAWYSQHLGLATSGSNSVNFVWNECAQPEGAGMTVFSLFPLDTAYFGQGRQPAMINFRVDDLDALLAQLRKAGVKIDPKREDHDYGRFAWIYDLEGNRVELWQPQKSSALMPDDYLSV